VEFFESDMWPFMVEALQRHVNVEDARQWFVELDAALESTTVAEAKQREDAALACLDDIAAGTVPRTEKPAAVQTKKEARQPRRRC
jgi:hypothetical protein